MHGEDDTMSWSEQVARDYEFKLARERALKQIESDNAKHILSVTPSSAFVGNEKLNEIIDEYVDGDYSAFDNPDLKEDLAFDLKMSNPLDTMSKILDDAIAEVSESLASDPGPPPGALTLTGAEMIAYVRVQAASIAAMAAQQAHEAAGRELRAAIEAQCQLLAPPVK